MQQVRLGSHESVVRVGHVSKTYAYRHATKWFSKKTPKIRRILHDQLLCYTCDIQDKSAQPSLLRLCLVFTVVATKRDRRPANGLWQGIPVVAPAAACCGLPGPDCLEASA